MVSSEDHSKYCTTCFNRVTYGKHTFENGECTVCHWEQDGNHDFENGASINIFSHSAFCANCGYVTVLPHSFEDGVCTLCGLKQHAFGFGEVSVHNVNSNMPYNDFYGHSVSCSTCGEHADAELYLHEFDENNVCKVCGYDASEDECIHEFVADPTYTNEATHYMKCSKCNFYFIGYHEFNADNVCVICGTKGADEYAPKYSWNKFELKPSADYEDILEGKYIVEIDEVKNLAELVEKYSSCGVKFQVEGAVIGDKFFDTTQLGNGDSSYEIGGLLGDMQLSFFAHILADKDGKTEEFYPGKTGVGGMSGAEYNQRWKTARATAYINETYGIPEDAENYTNVRIEIRASFFKRDFENVDKFILFYSNADVELTSKDPVTPTEPEVEVSGDAEAPKAAIDSATEDALKEEFKDEADQNGDVKVVLTVNGADSAVEDTQAAALTEFAGKNGYTVADFFDVTLTVNGSVKSETKNALSITFDLPAQLQGKNVVVLKYHAAGTGAPSLKVLNDLDSNPATVTISTNEFSAFALAVVPTQTPVVPPVNPFSHNGYVLDLGAEYHGFINGTSIITQPHVFNENGTCIVCGHVNIPATDGAEVADDNTNVTVEVPTEAPSTTDDPEQNPSDDINVEDGDTEENPKTALSFAVLPLMIAAAAATLSRKH